MFLRMCVSFQCQYRSYQRLHCIIFIFPYIWGILYGIVRILYDTTILHNTLYCNEIQNIVVFYVLPQDGKSIRPFLDSYALIFATT